ncbi:pyridoxamine 5'-phosphate oxidase family protein (plasmid) [Halobaculum sp. CBA1158]|uniref:pyridoxamine 5'-phosphate oxidase family protein n=1 Tax=Halobaculum sp. CBA1158 TaxID=2904243 RepID=UPI001F246CF6|nr:pyridoxamine 5'-phosphate oxidase family protein [Halobaculum sp. CBA1158]UIP01475.1 pyridoxamine 5'-phosphate oxidase family protein [Halobaculum sp. CBA1158]
MATEDPSSDGSELTDAGIDELLRTVGYGTLSLARDGEAYGIPVSFGYDGDRVFLYLIRFGDDSEKLDFAAETEQASLTVLDVNDRFDWSSVVVRGTLAAAEDVDHAEDVIDDNAWHPSLFASGTDGAMTEVRRMTLSVEEASGRVGASYAENVPEAGE